MGVIGRRNPASAAKGYGPVRLGKCHKKGWKSYSGFSCYKWFWYEGKGDSAMPKLQCICGGRSMGPPSDAPATKRDDAFVAEIAHDDDQLEGWAQVDVRGLPYLKSVHGHRPPVNDPVAAIMDTAIPFQIEQSPSATLVSLPSTPMVFRRNETGSSDPTKVFLQVLITIFGILGLAALINFIVSEIRIVRRAKLERQGDTTVTTVVQQQR